MMYVLPAIALAFVLQAPASRAKGSIEGTVVRAGTNDPIPRVQITALPFDPSHAPPTVVTDAQGHFLIKNLDPGTYSLEAERNGFAPQRYGQRNPRRPGTELNLDAGQELKGLVFTLTPAGAISGRVTDETGEPLVGINVGIERPIYDYNGKRQLSVQRSEKTDDRGEYRVFLLPPGQYYMRAVPQSSFTTRTMNPNYVATYYPGVSDSATAAVIEVGPGAEVGGIDLVLQKQQLFSLHGRVVDAKTGKPPVSGLNFLLYHRGSRSAVPYGALDYNPADGTFAVVNVPPGSYWIEAMLHTTRVEEQSRIKIATRIALAPVDVTSSDVRNIVLLFSPDVSIRGRISVDNGSAVADLPDLNVFRLGLEPKESSGGWSPQPFETSIHPDGTFLIEGVQLGDYRLWLYARQAKYYLKAARFEGDDVLTGIHVSGPASEDLEVVVGTDIAQFNGTVVDQDRKPASGVAVVLIPDRQRDRRDLYRTVRTDQNGRFGLLPVVPGEYKLFAWEVLEGSQYMDSDFLRKYEQLGTPVTVSPSGSMDFEAKLIPTSPQ
ncbi:MAG: hypothetical protein DMG15_02365 [Acidobacteria bacterium]|nr:MAG: hypothetical protein DMG15_02365 [Acidobacteriota bacterium]